MQFQYQRLANYSRKVNKAWNTAECKGRAIERILSNERKQWRKREAESKDALRERDALIEERDAKLKKWDGRKDVINHYMSIVEPMAKCVVSISCMRWLLTYARDIADMRAMLEELGYQVPARDYSYQPKSKSKHAMDKESAQHARRHDSSATLGKISELDQTNHS